MAYSLEELREDVRSLQADAEWIDMDGSFNTGWRDYASVRTTDHAFCKYWKDANGIVHLQGLAERSSGSNNLIITLPAGYRPPEQHLFNCRTSLLAADIIRLDVFTSGAVQLSGSGSSTGWVSFAGISFFVGNS